MPFHRLSSLALALAPILVVWLVAAALAQHVVVTARSERAVVELTAPL